jgi:hypothetical protein
MNQNMNETEKYAKFMKYLVKKDTKLRKKQHLFESKSLCLKFFFLNLDMKKPHLENLWSF